MEDCWDWEGEEEGSCVVDHCCSPVGDPEADGMGVVHSEELPDVGSAFRLPGVNWLMVDCITLMQCLKGGGEWVSIWQSACSRHLTYSLTATRTIVAVRQLA